MLSKTRECLLPASCLVNPHALFISVLALAAQQDHGRYDMTLCEFSSAMRMHIGTGIDPRFLAFPLVSSAFLWYDFYDGSRENVVIRKCSFPFSFSIRTDIVFHE